MDIAQLGIMAGAGTTAGVAVPRAFGGTMPMMVQGGAAGMVGATGASLAFQATGDPLTAVLAGMSAGGIAGGVAGVAVGRGAQAVGPTLGKGAAFGAAMGLAGTMFGFGVVSNLLGGAGAAVPRGA